MKIHVISARGKIIVIADITNVHMNGRLHFSLWLVKIKIFFF